MCDDKFAADASVRCGVSIPSARQLAKISPSRRPISLPIFIQATNHMSQSIVFRNSTPPIEPHVMSPARNFDRILIKAGWGADELEDREELLTKLTKGEQKDHGPQQFEEWAVRKVQQMMGQRFLDRNYVRLMTAVGWEQDGMRQDDTKERKHLRSLKDAYYQKPMSRIELEPWAIKNLSGLLIEDLASQHYGEFIEQIKIERVTGDASEETRTVFAAALKRLAIESSIPPVSEIKPWIITRLHRFLSTRLQLCELFEPRNHYNQFLRVTEACLPDRLKDSAPDCLAYIYHTLLARASSFDPNEGPLMAWVFGSISLDRGLVGEWLRSKHGAGRSHRETLESDMSDNTDGASYSIEEEAEDWDSELCNESLATIRELLNRLSPQKQALYKAIYGSDLTADEVAELFDEKPDFAVILMNAAKLFDQQARKIKRLTNAYHQTASRKPGKLAKALKVAGFEVKTGESAKAYAGRVAAAVEARKLAEQQSKDPNFAAVLELLEGSRTELDKLAGALLKTGLKRQRKESLHAYADRVLPEIMPEQAAVGAALALAETRNLLQKCGKDQVAARIRKQDLDMRRQLEGWIMRDRGLIMAWMEIRGAAAAKGILAPQLLADDANCLWDDEQVSQQDSPSKADSEELSYNLDEDDPLEHTDEESGGHDSDYE